MKGTPAAAAGWPVVAQPELLAPAFGSAGALPDLAPAQAAPPCAQLPSAAPRPAHSTCF